MFSKFTGKMIPLTLQNNSQKVLVGLELIKRSAFQCLGSQSVKLFLPTGEQICVLETISEIQKGVRQFELLLEKATELNNKGNVNALRLDSGWKILKTTVK